MDWLGFAARLAVGAIAIAALGGAATFARGAVAASSSYVLPSIVVLLVAAVVVAGLIRSGTVSERRLETPYW